MGDVLQLGRFTYDGTQSGMLFDDLTIFNRVLDADDMLQLAEAPIPLPSSATVVHSPTILVDTNAYDAEGSVAAVQMGQNGKFAHPDDYYDAFQWELSTEEGPHVVEVRYFDQAGNHSHLTRTVMLDLPPRGTADWATIGTLTATLSISATDMHQPIAMQVSAAPDFADAEWQPLQASVAWPLNDSEPSAYVRFRDSGGQVSEPLHVAAPAHAVYLPLLVRSQGTVQQHSAPTAPARYIYLPLVRQ
jgi:hypothetical protein